MRTALCLTLLATPALAQQAAPTRPPAITVTGTGSVETLPDRATLSFSIRGEGTTADDATRALATRQKALVAGLRGLDRQAEVRTGSVSIAEVRRGDCDNSLPVGGNMVVDMGPPDPPTDGKSGPCRVVGRLATMDGEVVLRSVKDAGTAVGLAGRLGASNARVDSFTLADDSAASARAVAAAIADARSKAEAIAKGTGARLGPILSVDDGGGRETVRAMQMQAFDVALPAPAPPPIAVDISPRPVETQARLVVSFALLP